MADEIQLKVSADIKEVNSAITATKKFEKQITNTVKALNDGKITNKAYNQSLLEIKRGYQEYSTSSQKATADVRKMANAIKEAEDAAKQQELAKAAIKNTQELNRLKMGYDKVYAAEQKRLRLKKLLRAEVAAGNMTLREAGRELLLYRQRLHEVSQGFQFAKNRANKFGMVAQQVGYQVGDFFVQVQSGASALVAFGQQGTQLAGLLPGIYGAIVGIGLSLGTMLVKTFMDASGASQTLSEALDELGSSSSAVMASFERLNDEKLNETFGDLTPTIKNLEDRFLALNSAAELRNLINVLEKVKESSEYGLFSKMGAAIGMGGTRVDIGPVKFAEDFGFAIGKDVFDYLMEGMIDQAKAGDTKGVLKAFDLLASQAAPVPAAITNKGLALLNEAKIAATALAESYAAIGGSAEAAVVANETANATTKKQLALIDDLLNAAEKSDAVTNDNLDAQLELMMKQYDEQIKIDALRDKETLKLDQQLWLANAINENNADAVEVAMIKANIARQNQEAIYKSLNFTKDEVTALMESYELLQIALTTNKEITEEKKRQLKVSEKIAASLVSMSDAEYQMLLTYQAYGQSRVAGAKVKPPKAPKGPKGKEPTTMEGPIKALERQIELSKALFGLEGDERRRKEVFMQLEFQNRDLLKQYQEDPATLQAIADRVAAQEKVVRVLEEQRQLQESVADAIANNMGDALMSMVDGTMSVKDAFKSMAMEIIKELYRILVVQQLVNAAKASMGGFFEDGGVFQGGSQVQAYADGGVVGSPTTFPMAGGRTGLMGEAGPEAIMPLKRGKDGKLGVQAEGGAGDVIIHQNFNFTANGDESVKKIIAQQAPAIANMTKRQILDDRRRGGQMKQTFG